mmetsp:Transcript_31067/g.61579  ORF Transcript_31067/g.61579 Transcript_31067/m.61579 type:complete len:285 (-) Transcript_31067:679-1533(-)
MSTSTLILSNKSLMSSFSPRSTCSCKRSKFASSTTLLMSSSPTPPSTPTRGSGAPVKDFRASSTTLSFSFSALALALALRTPSPLILDSSMPPSPDSSLRSSRIPISLSFASTSASFLVSATPPKTSLKNGLESSCWSSSLLFLLFMSPMPSPSSPSVSGPSSSFSLASSSIVRELWPVLAASCLFLSMMETPPTRPFLGSCSSFASFSSPFSSSSQPSLPSAALVLGAFKPLSSLTSEPAGETRSDLCLCLADLGVASLILSVKKTLPPLVLVELRELGGPLP